MKNSGLKGALGALAVVGVTHHRIASATVSTIPAMGAATTEVTQEATAKKAIKPTKKRFKLDNLLCNDKIREKERG